MKWWQIAFVVVDTTKEMDAPLQLIATNAFRCSSSQVHWSPFWGPFYPGALFLGALFLESIFDPNAFSPARRGQTQRIY